MTARHGQRVVGALVAAVLLSASAGCSAGGSAPPSPARTVSPPAPVATGPTRSESTQFGVAPEGGQDAASYETALARTEQLLGELDVVRVYYSGMPDPWPGKAPGRDVVVSFKISPDRVLSGSVDDSMRAWFEAAPQDADVYWVYYHEPEDDIEDGEFAADEFRAAFRHLSELAREASNPRLRATLVLMSYTLRPASGRDWRDYYPGDDALDVFAWDVYNRPSADDPYTDAQALLDPPRQVSDSTGLPFAVAELGSVLADGDDGTGRAAWLRAVGEYAIEHQAEFVTYFDLDFARNDADYRLRDDPSVAAWRSVTSN